MSNGIFLHLITNKHRCLVDPTDPSNRKLKFRKRSEENLLKELNQISGHQFTIKDLKGMIKNYHQQLRRVRVKQKSKTETVPQTQDVQSQSSSAPTSNTGVGIPHTDAKSDPGVVREANASTFDMIFEKHSCLFDPTDPCHKRLKYRRKCQENLLQELNQISSHQFTIQDLKLMIRNYQQKLRRKKQRSKTETLAQTQDVQNQPSSAPTSNTGVGIPHTDAKSDLGVVREANASTFDMIFEKHSCLFDPTDPCNKRLKYRRKCQENLLKELNQISSHQFTIQDLKQMIKCYRLKLWRKKRRSKTETLAQTQGVQSQPSSAPTSNTGVGIPHTDAKSDLGVVREANASTFDMIFEKHSCLFDPTDPCNKRLKYRRKCQENLLKELNQISSHQFTIQDLKQMIKCYRLKLWRKKRRSKTETLAQTQDVQNQPSSAPTSNTGVGTSHTDAKSDPGVVREANASTFDMIFEKHSCLFDPTDPCHKRLKYRRKCKENLLQELNQNASHQFTIQDLKEMIKNYRQKLWRKKRRSKTETLAQTQDVQNQPSSAPTSNTGVGIPHTDAKSDLGVVREANASTFDMIFEKHSCLFDPTDPCNKRLKYRRKCQENLLKELNQISSHQFTIQDLKLMIRNYQQKLRRKKQRSKTETLAQTPDVQSQPSSAPTSNTGVGTSHTDAKSDPGVVREANTSTFDMIFEKHSCLFDPTDPCRRRLKCRKKCKENLLKELNQISSHQFTIQDLKEMINNYQQKLRRKKQRSKTETLAQTQDVQNQPSSAPTSNTGVGTSHTDAKSDPGVVREANASTFDMIFEKHSCLFDPTDPCRRRLKCRKKCKENLLKELNQISSHQFTIQDLKQMIKNYQQKLWRKKRRSKTETLAQIQDTKSSATEPTTDTAVGTPHTHAELDLVVVKEEVDSPTFDVVVKYEETSDEDGESSTLC